jgi:hypothetical protein
MSKAGLTYLVLDMVEGRAFVNTTMNLPSSYLFPMALRSNVTHGLLILEVSRSCSDTLQSVGLLWTSDQLVAETST